MPIQHPKLLKLYGDHLLNGHCLETNIELAQKYYIAAYKNYSKAGEALIGIYSHEIGSKSDILKVRNILDYARKHSSPRIQKKYTRLLYDFCKENQLDDGIFAIQVDLANVHDKKGLCHLIQSANSQALFELGKYDITQTVFPTQTGNNIFCRLIHWDIQKQLFISDKIIII